MSELIITSPAFAQGGLIPVEYTGYGEDRSPELVLTGLDADAKSMAVIMDDRSHLIPDFNHWVIWNLPPMPVIPGGIPHGKRVAALQGAVQGIGYGRHRYRGPKPPFQRSHEYAFHVYVLSGCLDLPDRGKKRDLLRAMEGKLLQQGTLTGHYR